MCVCVCVRVCVRVYMLYDVFLVTWLAAQISEMLLWAKEQNEEKSPTLTAFTEHFNNVSQW